MTDPIADPMTHSEYVKAIRPLLPAAMFRPCPRRLLPAFAHVAVIFAGWSVVRHAEAIWVMALAGIVIGHSSACLMFLAHDVSHGATLPRGRLRSAVELVMWGVNGIPATLWRGLHNKTHHVHASTLRDCDRPLRVSESTLAVRIYNLLFVPSRRLPWNPLVLLNFIVYIAKHLVGAMMPGDAKPSIAACKPNYTSRERRAMAIELSAIVVGQVALFFGVGGDWVHYLFVSVVPLCVASAVAMTYIWSNHGLAPLFPRQEVLLGTMSVIVPRWLDWLHDDFSYHTEHHLFPNMNPRFYPQVSAVLAERFPDRYQRISLAAAWRLIWKQDAFVRETDAARSESPEREGEASGESMAP